MAAIPTAADADHIPQWAVKGLLALLALIFIPGSIATVSYIVGGIHSRLSENEKAIQTLKEERAAFNARLERTEDVDRRQWQLLGENKDKLASHHHTH
jgi:hypothetical protein